MTPKQIVLRKYPKAKCLKYWPCIWFVEIDSNASDSIAQGGRTAAEAWAKAAKKIKK